MIRGRAQLTAPKPLTPAGIGCGGDGIVITPYDEISQAPGVPLKAPLDSTAHSHLIAFAAEEARLAGRTVDVEEFSRRVAGTK